VHEAEKLGLEAMDRFVTATEEIRFETKSRDVRLVNKCLGLLHQSNTLIPCSCLRAGAFIPMPARLRGPW
jgi:hypothetical protein